MIGACCFVVEGPKSPATSRNHRDGEPSSFLTTESQHGQRDITTLAEPLAAPAVCCRTLGKPSTREKGETSMSLMSPVVQRSTLGLHSLEQYEPLIGAATAARIRRKIDRVRTMHV